MLREQIAIEIHCARARKTTGARTKNWNDLTDWQRNVYRSHAKQILSLLRSEIEKVKNPYKSMTAEEAGKTPVAMCELEVGFEDARQAILKVVE